MPITYDCCVLGAGIAGTTSALVLSQLGLRVLVVEAERHPRFAIGESLVPTTTLGFEYLARTYSIPELRQISHYPEMTELGLAGWPKLGFWFGHHQTGHRLQTGHEMMFVSPGLPTGPDVHMLRSDVDSFLASRLVDYRVEYLDQTSVVNLKASADECKLVLETDGQRQLVLTRFVLDCSGHNSFLAKHHGLRDDVPCLRTQTRTIFSHFHGVRLLEDVIGQPCARFGTRRDACTIHHCFEGGWIWVIRFDNERTSVGVVLDCQQYPESGMEAEDEFWSFVNRFPTVREQLAESTAIRPLTKSGRLQFTSRRIAGDRYLLAPHAANFIDSLFSTGMDLTTAFIARMAPLIARLSKEDDFRATRFEALETCHRAEIDFIDRIVHGMFCSFRTPDVFKQYWRCWVYASLIQYFSQLAVDPSANSDLLAHYGASLPGWRGQLEKMYHAVTNSGISSDELAELLKASMDEFLEPCDVERSNWEIGSKDACCPFFAEGDPMKWFEKTLVAEPVLAERTRRELLADAQYRFQTADDELARRYETSLADGTPFHRGVDFIRSQQLDAHK